MRNTAIACSLALINGRLFSLGARVQAFEIEVANSLSICRYKLLDLSKNTSCMYALSMNHMMLDFDEDHE